MCGTIDLGLVVHRAAIDALLRTPDQHVEIRRGVKRPLDPQTDIARQATIDCIRKRCPQCTLRVGSDPILHQRPPFSRHRQPHRAQLLASRICLVGRQPFAPVFRNRRLVHRNPQAVRRGDALRVSHETPRISGKLHDQAEQHQGQQHHEAMRRFFHHTQRTHLPCRLAEKKF
jgi:hypothetical protein